MIAALVFCASLLIYGPLETTALKAACRPASAPRRVIMAETVTKTVVVPRAKPKPAHRIRIIPPRKDRVTRCGRQRVHWYWNKRLHRRRYRCR